MLVLSRNANETVMIGDDISVTVAEIRGNRVRLGFVAPRGVAIHRKEIFDVIQFGKKASVGASARARAKAAYISHAEQESKKGR